MRIPSVIRRLPVFLALFALGATVVPIHVHADHTAEIAHLERGHGAHDGVVLQDDVKQRVEPVHLVFFLSVTTPVGPEAPESEIAPVVAEPTTPSLPPPRRQPATRAPPTLL